MTKVELHKIADELFFEFTDQPNWKNIINVISHELTHFRDDVIHPFKGNDAAINNAINKYKKHHAVVSPETANDIATKTYFNSTDEYNAYLVQGMAKYLEALKNGKENLPDDFRRFYQIFLLDYYEARQEYLNDNTKKHVEKRLYDFYMHLREEKYGKDQLKEKPMLPG